MRLSAPIDWSERNAGAALKSSRASGIACLLFAVAACVFIALFAPKLPW